ncbi:hypothetical protein VTH06DRAFT_7325 [Thermothelomyces fergusii]
MASPRHLCRPLRQLKHGGIPGRAGQSPRSRFISSSAAASASSSEAPPPSSIQNNNHDDNTTTTTTASKPSRPKKALTREQQAFLSSALRVNQAGELAATLIYTAQTPAVVGREPGLRPLMRHMYEQEAGHLATFEGLLAQRRVRPSALYPLWSALAAGLGWATGLMGREAAMACTEAVETEIGGHYNAQIRTLLEMVAGWEAEGYDVGDEFRELIETLRRIRDEELEHLDHAVAHDSKKAEPHWLLTGIIRAGCRGAIWVSERV